MSRGARTWARAAAGLVAGVALLALGIAARSGESPWFQLALLVFGPLLVWETAKKLTSHRPVTDNWDGHIRFFLLGAALLVGGCGAAVTGGDTGTLVNRAAGVVAAAVGVVLVGAERRDFRQWRTEVADTRARQDWPHV